MDVFNLICTLHNTIAVRFAIYRYNYPSISQSVIPNVYNRPSLNFGFNNPSVWVSSLLYVYIQQKQNSGPYIYKNQKTRTCLTGHPVCGSCSGRWKSRNYLKHADCWVLWVLIIAVFKYCWSWVIPIDYIQGPPKNLPRSIYPISSIVHPNQT